MLPITAKTEGKNWKRVSYIILPHPFDVSDLLPQISQMIGKYGLGFMIDTMDTSGHWAVYIPISDTPEQKEERKEKQLKEDELKQKSIQNLKTVGEKIDDTISKIKEEYDSHTAIASKENIPTEEITETISVQSEVIGGI